MPVHRLGSRFAASLLVLGLTLPAVSQAVPTDAQITADVQKRLDSKRFHDVKATVTNGLVTLTGSVDLYATKEDAEQKIHHRRGVVAVINHLSVGTDADTTAISDVELRNKLAEKLAYDRVGYATTAFNSFSIGVQNGVVTLGGTAYGPTDKASAVSLVEHYPGVKDVVDDIEVAPVSPNDDRIRVEAARAIYGYPQLSRYAIDPAKPIRITVVNGNITLTGVVDSQADKDVAGLRANGVSGAFKVTNNLQVAGKSNESR